MKKYILLLILSVMIPSAANAQSGMTDEQVMQFVVKENAAGTSQAQIVTKLMQNGVNIEQIRRVRNKYERLAKNQGLGTSEKNVDKGKADSRMRKDNSKNSDGEEQQDPQYRIKDTRKSNQKEKTVYDETNPDWEAMHEELLIMNPDTATMLKQLMAEKKKKKVFGRDIFNNKELTFEPNMNIATPQNYRLGPGDAVYIDIYGASQKTIESTVSPDGTVTIEGYGPVQVSGLTVEQANARLRSTLGSRYSSSKIRLTVGQTRTIMVNVMGEVKNPGTYTLPAFATVFHALYMAGGTNDLGTMRNIKVYRINRLVSSVDIYD